MKSIIKKVYNWYISRLVLNRISSSLCKNHYLEFGGPSFVFSAAGPFKIYTKVDSLILVDFADKNFWSGLNDHQIDHARIHRVVSDATNFDLNLLKDVYCVLSSHMVEHLANPLKYLKNVYSGLDNGALIVTVLPYYKWTYDRSRKPTNLDHIIDDFNNNMDENDLTHLKEVIDSYNNLHQGPYYNFENFVVESENNHFHRKMHHHCFDKKLVKDLHEYAGFTTLMCKLILPMHIIYVGKK